MQMAARICATALSKAALYAAGVKHYTRKSARLFRV
jgi:hypothetical protein